MPKTPAKPARPPPLTGHEAEAANLFAFSQLHRFADVRPYGSESVELVPKPAAHVTTVFRVESDGRRSVRILVGPIAPPAGKPRG
jgi:hypothetical protein